MESSRIVKAQGKNYMLDNDVITQVHKTLILLIKLRNKAQATHYSHTYLSSLLPSTATIWTQGTCIFSFLFFYVS